MKWLAIALFLLNLLPGVASAHAILVESQPAANATISPGQAAIRLRFNSRIDRDRSRLVLVAPDQDQTRMAVADTGPPDVMTAAAKLQNGDYTLRWQVLAVDGHITRGDVPFKVASPSP